MSGFGLARTLMVVFGILTALSGLAGVAVGRASAAAGAWGVGVGLVLVVAAVIERSRYRSDAAEATAEPPGTAGGEPTGVRLDPRFAPTAERFEDPTTRQRMRVWIDARSGERRYVPED